MATEQQGSVLRVIGTVADKYKLADTKYSDIHIGKEPEFIVSPSKRLSKALKKEVKEKEKKEKKEKKEMKEKKKNSSEYLVAELHSLLHSRLLAVYFISTNAESAGNVVWVSKVV